MNWKCYLGCAALFLAGLSIGTARGKSASAAAAAAAEAKGKLAGRESACADYVAVINGNYPGMDMECVTVDNEVYLQTPRAPGKKFTLNGHLAE